jgi:hypothetical protein
MTEDEFKDSLKGYGSKLGPCPSCLGIIKPCRCQLMKELCELKARRCEMCVRFRAYYTQEKNYMKYTVSCSGGYTTNQDPQVFSCCHWEKKE